MNKSSLIVLLLTTSTAVSTILPRVVAQTAMDCLPIPDNVKTVVVSKDKAAIRTTAQKLDNPGNIVVLAKLNESLEVFNHKPTFKDNYCWYEVKTPKDKTSANQPALWVAKENLKPFDSTGTPTPPTQSPQPSPSITPNTQQSPKETLNTDDKQTDYWSLYWTILTGFVAIGSVLGLVAVAYIIYKLREEINGLKYKIVDNHGELSKRLFGVETLDAKIKNFEYEKRTDQAQIGEIYKALENARSEIQSLRSQINSQPQTSITSPVTRSTPAYPAAASSPKTATNEIDIVISKFNSQDKLYFNDPRFHPVKLTKESIQGKVGVDARRIIRFEPAASSQDAYLEFYAYGENWLIPNIIFLHFYKVLNQLLENQEIFTINSGSGNSQLIKPAKLKSISAGVWEIAEPGEFGDKHQPIKNKNQINLQPQKNEENYSKLAEQLSELQKKYNTLESKIPKSTPLKEPEENYIKLAEQLSELQKKYNTLESKIPESPPPHLSNSQPASSSQNKTSSTSQSIQSTVELSIMNYLKKNGNSTFYQLRLGIECEEQILRQSLIKLDKEDYINVEISPDHNVIYKVE